MSLENTERQPLLADPSLDTTLRSKYIQFYLLKVHTYVKPLVQLTVYLPIFKLSNQWRT
jgi:hypothetical protein